MALLAKAIVKNKCWIVEDNGNKVGTILANPAGVVYQHENKREQFASIKLLSKKYNIEFVKAERSKCFKPLGTSVIKNQALLSVKKWLTV